MFLLKKYDKFRMFPTILHLWMNTLCLIRPSKAFFSSLFDTFIEETIFMISISFADAQLHLKRARYSHNVIDFVNYFATVKFKSRARKLLRVKHLLRAGSSLFGQIVLLLEPGYSDDSHHSQRSTIIFILCSLKYSKPQ